MDPEVESLVIRLKDHARNLYETRQLLCSEAVLVALNQGLSGGLTEDQAVTMAAPFCVAMGDSGCLCGALSGAVLAAGLFMGNDRPYSHRKEMRESGLTLHNAFRAAHGATCCRVLSKSVRHDKKAHFNQCAEFTANAAEMAARLILENRPDLARAAAGQPLPVHHGKIGGLLKKLFKRLS
ncbi:C-GCAxxG-C-C family protein [Desulfospira joergensenii]|uniref:C-GCAxxG-C-C family protein n=1 Tax=Desulfospira joergensenii TaxID=53329 RepID=UPI00040FBD6E|nr:C-GCAxxG-C-C family protein [Desulfospira joergensenii]